MVYFIIDNVKMWIILDAEKVPDYIQLPDKGWETIIWLKSWSEESEEVYLHRVKITHVETEEGKTQFHAHFQLFRNDNNRVVTLIPPVWLE